MVALHSAHAESEIQKWLPTLQCLLDLGVSTVLTTYNKQEAVDEEQICDDIGAHFSKRLAEYLWREVLPKFETFMYRYDVYYSDYYWYIIKGKAHE